MNNKILIAEDESNIRKLVAYYLTQEGFSVSEACCGTEALTYFEKNPDLALVILDVMMPEPNGCEVCRAIRRCSNVPILSPHLR